ncbi:hypothetical protein B0I27_101105 [Arcticibacter pallidicorallinus]|uniref:Uncharacterized protein n=1 Tax=Arcticibacter pallidicorallinus TaxID=1259464 RepID=A0A2T0UBE8_9SPHI|nr:hypothetical protein [Arcticibacter pallidicorallinus]PRY55137.1 hypothetical protein B0I27_101105 [Arcticibacter pallidicorallinus]
MEFERFAIHIDENILFVIPQGDDTYIIYQGDKRLGVIEREWINAEQSWASAELGDAEYIRHIGNAIDDQEM